MAKRVNHIRFLKMLVCPDEVRDGVVSFEEWCNRAVNEKVTYLEERTFFIMEFFSAFKRLYYYACDKLENDIIKNITCNFKKDEKIMIVKIKYLDDILIDEKEVLKKYFDRDNLDYDHYKIKCVNDDEPKIIIEFYKDDWS